jgi:hypothetical protein
MSGTATGGVTNQFHQFSARFGRIQEALLAVPGHIHQQLESMLMGQVEEPPRRHMIHSKKVASEGLNLGEISAGGIG